MLRPEGLQVVSLKAKKIKIIFFDKRILSLERFSSYFYYLFLLTEFPANLLFFHGAAFIKNEKALVFFGPSGAGKSTVMGLAEEYEQISDENLVIVRRKDGYRVYSYPFFGQGKNLQGFPLSKIFFLVKDKKDSVDPEIDFSEACDKALKQVLFLKYKKAHLSFLEGEQGYKEANKQLFNSIYELVKKTLCADLHFTKSRKFLEYI